MSWALWLGILFFGAALPLLAPRPAASFADSMPLSFASGLEADSVIDDDTTTASLEAEPAAAKSPASISSDGEAAPLFGMQTAPLIGGAIPQKWTRARAEIAREFESLERCRADDACPAVAQRLIDLSAEGAGRSSRARVGLINRAVDLAIIPTSDDTQWSVEDRWSAPFETLQSGRGDCEDYAIVKYLALLEAGLSEDDVKIVILKNTFPNEDHAVLAVRVDGDWLILDNRTLTLVRDMDLRRATPEFVLDRQGAKRFVTRERSRRVG
jgi:predicted transglutaminase-like cysteine proteinase